MNHIYRSIWNDSTATYVAAAETSKSGGKKASASTGSLQAGRWALRALSTALCLAYATGAAAMPQGGVVTAGRANVTVTPGNMTIVQGSQSAVLNWQSFGIGAGESVQFVQPNASAVALNRVVGTDPSAIFGNLSANGKVFLVNPNGILFGKGASVNVGGLVASALDIRDSDFMAGHYRFSGNSTQAVNNQGTINAPGGYVAMLGAHVSNEGVIAVRLGSVALAGGQAITLDVAGDGLLNVAVDQGAVNALVSNGGLIQADGGQVLITAQAAGKLLNTVVNNTGVIQAQTLVDHNGSIKLLGDMQTGTVNAAGTLDASAPAGGNGGFVETSAARVKLDDALKVTTASGNGLTGNWLIDPSDYTIAATGGDQTGAFFSNALTNSAVEIQSISGASGTAGNVNVNDTISWSANKLTLTAHNDININAPLRGSGTASLALQYGQGNAASGNTSKYNVKAEIDLPSGKNFSTKLGSNGLVTDYTVINSLGVAGSTSGTDLQGVSGALNGNYVLGANIDASATSGWNAGLGFMPIGTGGTPFSGEFDGLGRVISGLVINRPGTSYVGLFGATSGSAIVRNVGIESGSVIGGNTSGALVGLNLGLVDGSYSTVSVTGGSQVGGLVGLNGIGGVVRNSYASGAVSGTGIIGGLAGSNSGILTNNYATGTVIGGHTMGGLTGASNGTASGNFWNITTSGMASSGAGTGLTTAQMKLMANYGAASWDLANTWIVYDSYTNPLLRAFMTPLQVTFTSNASKTYDGTNNWTPPTAVFSNPSAVLEGSLNYGAAGSAVNAGTHAITADGLYSGQRGYAISSNAATLTIDRKGATLTGATVDTRAYDGTTAATLSGGTLVGVLSPDVLNINFNTGTFDTKDAGTGKSVTAITTGSAGGNYIVTATGLTGIITPKALTVTGLAAITREYNAGIGATLTGGTLNGLVGSETLGLGASIGVFGNKNAGTGKTVTVTPGTLSNGSGLASNYTLDAPSGVTGTITPKALSWTNLAVEDKVYDGNSTAGISKGSITGLLSGETLAAGPIATFADKNAGNSKVVTVSTSLGNGSGGLASNYTLADTTVLASITPKPLTLTGAVAGNKAYDGTVAAVISGGALSGLVGSETVGLGVLSGRFADKNAGNGKAVTVTGGSLSNGSNGGLASNYTVGSVTGLAADITPKALTVTGVTVASKVYDGNTKATMSGGTLNGLVSGETLTLSGQSGTFNDQNAGNGKAVTVTGATLGSGTGLASNYTVSNATGATGNITRKALTVSGATASDKVYDGSTAATLSGGTLSGMVGSETLGLSSLSGVFGDKNVGSGKTVTVTGGALSNGNNGGLASNYTVGAVTGLNASITPKALTVSGMSASTKAYDGSTKASLTGGTLNGLVAGESVDFSGQTGGFSDKNVGSGKGVTVTGITLVDGLDLASNYSVSNPTGVTGDITPKELTISGVNASNRVYNGGVNATLGGSVLLGGLVGAETFDVTGMSGVFADKNAGTGKVVIISGATLGNGANGGLASNYTLSNPTGVTANVSQASVTVSNIVADSKVYDGNTKASVTNAGAAFGGMITGDALTVSATSATFNDKNAGSGKAVTASGLTLGGSDAGNYNLTTTSGAGTGAITPKALTITGMSAVSKVYDGNTKATLSGGSVSGLVGAETLGVTGLMASFDTKDAGTAKAVTVTGTTLVNGGNGGLASNYTMSNPTGFTANITSKPLTVSGMTAGTRVYDGTTTAALSGGALTGLVSGETLVISGGTGVFADKNVGTGKAVTVSGVGIADGSGLASNYTVTNPTNVTGSITQKTLSVSGALAADKTYDGALNATITGGSLSGFIGSETVVLASLAGAFADKNAGIGKAVSVTGGTLSNGSNGGLASNYAVGPVTGLSARITQKTLSVTGVTVANKIYDGTAKASLTGGALSGLVGGETLGLSGLAGAFADKNAGIGKTVTVSGSTLTDGTGLASNYTVSNPTTVTANIDKATISSVSNIVADTKVYDGGTSVTFASASAIFNGMISGDSLSIGATTAAFTDKNAATGKTVNISFLTLGGTDAANYQLASTTGTGTGTITPKALTITGMSAVNKVYDGNTKASVTGGSISGLVGSESLGVTGLTVTFDTKDAGTAKAMTATGTTLVNGGNGGLASNYSMANPTGFTANITPKALTVSGMTAVTREYDGTTAATLTGGSLSGLVTGETLGLVGGTGVFIDKDAGNGKAVTVTGSKLVDGNGSASNYSVTSPTGVTGSITPKMLTVAGVTVGNKVYDGNAVAALSGGSLSGLVGSETVGLAGLSGAFSDKNAANGKTVTLSGASLVDGTGLASNYSVNYPTGLTADITPKALTVAGVTVGNKVYDGNAVAALSGGSLSGLVGSETVGLAGLSGAFSDKNAANGKTVTLSGASLVDGTGLASNYSVSNPAGLTADITPKALTVAGVTVGNKVYDGNAVAALSGGSLSGLVGSETLGLAGLSGAFSDKNAANGKNVTLSGASLVDGTGLASNYSVSNPAGLTADITPKALTIAGMTAANKVFDGTPVASLSGGTLIGLVGNETLQLSGFSGAFDSASVGSAKAVTVSGSTLSNDSGLASNYTVSNPTGLRADITAGASLPVIPTTPTADRPTAGNALVSVDTGNSPFAATGPGQNSPVPLEGASEGREAQELQTEASIPFSLAALPFSIKNKGIRLPSGVAPVNQDDDE